MDSGCFKNVTNQVQSGEKNVHDFFCCLEVVVFGEVWNSGQFSRSWVKINEVEEDQEFIDVDVVFFAVFLKKFACLLDIQSEVVGKDPAGILVEQPLE